MPVILRSISNSEQGESVLQVSQTLGMVTRRISEDFHGFLANALGYQYTQPQKLISPVIGGGQGPLRH